MSAARSSEQGSVLDANFHEMMRNRLGSGSASSANSAKQQLKAELMARKEELERLKAEAIMAKRYAQEMAAAEMRAAHEELRALEEQRQQQQQAASSQQRQAPMSLKRALAEASSKLLPVQQEHQVPSPPKPLPPPPAPRVMHPFEQLMASVVARGQQQQQQQQQAASSVPIPVAQPVHAQIVPAPPPAPPMASNSTVIRSKPNSISWVSGQDDQPSSAAASSTPPRAASNRFAERAREFRLQKAEALAARLREEADLKNHKEAKRNSISLGYVVPQLKLDRYNSEQFVNQTECEEFECSICFHVAFDPVDLETCSHHFCRSCLESWGKKFCPTCTNSFEKSKMKSMSESKTKLWTLQTKCEHASRGCDWVGALGVHNSLYLDHLRSCAFAPVNCLHCQQSMNRSFVEIHRKEFCPFRLLKCQFCSNEVAANKMNKHVTVPVEQVKDPMHECKEEESSDSNGLGPCVMTRYCPYKCRKDGAITVRHVFNLAEHVELHCPNRPIDCILCPPFRAHSALSYEAMKDHMTQVLFQSDLNLLDNGARGQSREEEETVQQLLKAADELTRYRKNFSNSSAMVQPVEQHIVPIAPALSSTVVPQAPPMHAVVATPPTRSIGTVLSNSRQDKMREEKEKEECVDFPSHPPLLLSSNSQLPRVGLSADQLKKVPSPKASVLPAASLPLPPVFGRSSSNPSSLNVVDSSDSSASSNRRHRTPPANLKSAVKKKLDNFLQHLSDWDSEESEHASDLSDFSGDDEYEEIEAGTKKADMPVALAGSGAMAASALAVAASAAASASGSASAASPQKDNFIDIIFNLPGISENATFRVLRNAPLTSVLSQNPFTSLRQKVKFYIVSEDGRDWDEVHESCTPAELGLPDRSKIGMKL